MTCLSKSLKNNFNLVFGENNLELLPLGLPRQKSSNTVNFIKEIETNRNTKIFIYHMIPPKKIFLGGGPAKIVDTIFKAQFISKHYYYSNVHGGAGVSL
jgi:hypothetical protein